MTFNFEDLTTAAGAAAVAGLAVLMVQLLKAVLPSLFKYVTGALVAFIFTGCVYVLGAIVLSPLTANGYLALFIAWAFCAATAVGIKVIASGGTETFVKDSPVNNAGSSGASPT